MEKFNEVLAMDGYGVYVWPSFGFAALAMIAMVWMSLRSLRRVERIFSQMQKEIQADEA